jgi:molybdopterin biosynthesis enzyme
VLAEDVTAQEPIPAAPTSIMDGYAVVAADGAGEFEMVGGISFFLILQSRALVPSCMRTDKKEGLS